MKTLGKISKTLNSRTLSNYGLRPYLSQFAHLKKDEHGKWNPASCLIEPWNLSLSLTDFIADLQSFSLTNEDYYLKEEASFFVTLSHIVYVPFGLTGFHFLKSVVEERQSKSIGEFLYEKLLERIICPLNGNLFSGLTEDELLYIKNYFINFDSLTQVNCSKPTDIATFVCNLYFELYSDSSVKDLIDNIVDELDTKLINLEANEVFIFPASDYLSKLPKHEALSSQEKKFLLDKFQISLK